MSSFSYIVTPSSIAFTSPSGKTLNVTDAHISFREMVETIKAIQSASNAGNIEEALALHETLTALAEPARKINAAGDGAVRVVDGLVLYGDVPIHNAITERILWGLGEGFDMKPYMLFLENLMQNPSKRAVDELYRFMEHNKMGITEDGHLIAYKRVRDDFKDIHSGTFDNSPGQIVEMPRNRVDDDPTRTCSDGLHFCSMSYLPHFGSSAGNRIVLVKINPRDMVSVPIDYDNAKARCCRYEVVSEYTGDDKEDLLATKPIWSDADWSRDASSWGDGDYDESDDYDHEDDDEDADEGDDEDNEDDLDNENEDLEAEDRDPYIADMFEQPVASVYNPDGTSTPVYAGNTAPMVPRTMEVTADDYVAKEPGPNDGRNWGDPPNGGQPEKTIRSAFYRYDTFSNVSVMEVIYSDGSKEEISDPARIAELQRQIEARSGL